jgi:hypothetical protein
MPPQWLIPWLVPILFVVAVLVGVLVGWVGAALVLGVVIASAVFGRVSYVKRNPPDPELPPPKRFGLPF